MPLAISVLGGGPDAEREVSLRSSAAVAEALGRNPNYRVTRTIIDRMTGSDLAGISADVFFPVLHGGFGEGGPLQDLLEADGRPYVGCRPHAARMCMDKLATKLAAAAVGIATQPAAVFNPRDAACPIELPVVLKPIHEGSSVGVRFARSSAEFVDASDATREDMRLHPDRSYMIEHAVPNARELTVGMLDGKPLPIIEIKPKVEFYDYDAKYNRSDTQYTVEPTLPGAVGEELRDASVSLFRALGVRHLCRVDFLLDEKNRAWLLEVNTMPGFTDHSLVPKAAARTGLDMTALTSALVELARRDAR